MLLKGHCTHTLLAMATLATVVTLGLRGPFVLACIKQRTTGNMQHATELDGGVRVRGTCAHICFTLFADMLQQHGAATTTYWGQHLFQKFLHNLVRKKYPLCLWQREQNKFNAKSNTHTARCTTRTALLTSQRHTHTGTLSLTLSQPHLTLKFRAQIFVF